MSITLTYLELAILLYAVGGSILVGVLAPSFWVDRNNWQWWAPIVLPLVFFVVGILWFPLIIGEWVSSWFRK